MWIALFSQTGNELYNIINQGIYPDIIYTNNLEFNNDKLIKVCKDKNIPIHIIEHVLDVNRYHQIFKNSTIITLHGFLKIIPKPICHIYNIFNLHPALINYYPELKGKDPQIRTFSGSYNKIGCVIHKVITEVDEGLIYVIKEKNYNKSTMDNLYKELKDIALSAWMQFFEPKQVRVAISGAQSVGKSTLIEYLAPYLKLYNITKVTEITREVSKTHKINEQGNDETQLQIIKSHHNTFLNKSFVCDRCILDGYVYTKYLYEQNKISTVVMSQAFSSLMELINLYDYIFYIKPEFELIEDGVRSNNIEFRNRIVEIFDNTINLYNIPIIMLTGNTKEKADQIINILGKH